MHYSQCHPQPVHTNPLHHMVSSMVDLKVGFPASFGSFCSMPSKYHITVDPHATPVQHGFRREPIEPLEKIKVHLQKMITLGMITPETTPKTRMSSLTKSRRVNRSMCGCLDLKNLNKGIICEHHKAPTLEEVT